jgi:hypothetical protein
MRIYYFSIGLTLIFNKVMICLGFMTHFLLQIIYIVPHILTDFSNKYNWSRLPYLLAKENLIAPLLLFSLLKIYFLNLAIFQVQGRNDITFFLFIDLA